MSAVNVTVVLAFPFNRLQRVTSFMLNFSYPSKIMIAAPYFLDT